VIDLCSSRTAFRCAESAFSLPKHGKKKEVGKIRKKAKKGY